MILVGGVVSQQVYYLCVAATKTSETFGYFRNHHNLRIVLETTGSDAGIGVIIT